MVAPVKKTRRIQNTAEYVNAALAGGLGGGTLGLVAHKSSRAIRIGTGLGVVAAVAGRKALSGNVDTLHQNERDKAARVVGNIPGYAGLGTFVGGSYVAEHLGRHAEANAFLRRAKGTPDDIGGDMEAKLDRLYRGAKGTPEGDAALRKLSELRQRKGKTFTGKAKKTMSNIVSKFTPKAKREVSGLIRNLSARDQLNEIKLSRGEMLRKATARLPLDKVEKEIGRRLPWKAHPRGSLGALIQAMKLRTIRQMSASDQLNEILEFGSKKSPMRKIANIIPKKMTAEEIEKAEERLRKKMKPGKLAPMSGAVSNPGPTVLSAREELDSILALKAVDLGYDYGDTCAGYPTPCTPNKRSFPSLDIYDQEDELDLPDSGVAQVKFRVTSRRSNTGQDGKAKHGATIEIRSIESTSKKKGQRNPKEGEHAKLIPMSAREELDSILFTDPRPRNDLGEFSGTQETGTPSPNAIVKAYSQAGKSVGQTLSGGAVAGAGALASQSAIKSLIAKVRKARV